MARSSARRTYVVLVRLSGVRDGWIHSQTAPYFSSPCPLGTGCIETACIALA